MAGFDRIVVIGCGTVGLPLAVAFAGRGLTVLGVDIDARRVRRLSAGRMDAIEDGLADALAAAIAGGRIAFATSIVRSSEPVAFVLAVPTPVDAKGRFLRASLDAAVASVAQEAMDGDLLIVRATLPIGGTRAIADRLRNARAGLLVAACPDRSVSGSSLSEQFTVPHIVGGVDDASRTAAARVLARLGPVIEVGSPEAAEAIKLFCNTQRDARFAIANQFALVCETLGLDLDEIRRAATSGYSRFDLPRPGPVGGPCLSKDVFLLAGSPGIRAPMLDLLLSARRLNGSLVDHVAGRIASDLETADKPAVAILGLAFKGRPPTADRRGSFGIELARTLEAGRPGLEIRTWDPQPLPGEAPIDLDRVTRGAGVIVLANDHEALARLDLPAIARMMHRPGIIYDLCGAHGDKIGTLPDGVELRVFGRAGARPKPIAGVPT